MIGSKKLFWELTGVTLVILFLTLLVFSFTNSKQILPEIIYGYFVSLVIFSSGFVSIHWSLNKSIKTFMIIVLGGMFLRFVLIGLALFLLIRLTNINILFFLGSFCVFYLIYQIFEIRFINAKISKDKKWLKLSERPS